MILYSFDIIVQKYRVWTANEARRDTHSLFAKGQSPVPPFTLASPDLEGGGLRDRGLNVEPSTVSSPSPSPSSSSSHKLPACFSCMRRRWQWPCHGHIGRYQDSTGSRLERDRRDHENQTTTMSMRWLGRSMVVVAKATRIEGAV